MVIEVVNMDVVWGALAGAGLGGVGGAALGGTKWAVVGGVAGGAVLGGLVGYAVSGAYYDLTHLNLPNPLAGLGNAFSGLGKAWDNAVKGIEGIPGNIAKGVEGAARAAGQALAAATNPVPYPGHQYTAAAVQPGSGGEGAVSPAASPIHGTEVEVPRVVGLERNMSIKGTPLFPNIQPNLPSPAVVQEENQLATNPNATPEQWKAIGGSEKTVVVDGVPVTWVTLPGSTETFKSIAGYQPNPYGGGM